MAIWKSITLSASLLAVAIGFAVAAPVTVRSDVALHAGPGPNFGVVGHVPGGTRLDTTDWNGGVASTLPRLVNSTPCLYQWNLQVSGSPSTSV